MSTATIEITPTVALALHKFHWDMPALVANHREVAEWLSDRIEIHFGMVSEVILVDRATGTPKDMRTNDVRVAVEAWLVDQIAATAVFA